MNLQVGVKLLIKNGQGKYLFVRRAPSFKPGEEQKWDIPGGRIEPDEPLEAALAREVREETGLTVSMARLLAAQDIFVKEKQLHVVRLTYIGTTEGEKISISDEHSEYKWMDRAEVIKEPLDRYIMELKGLL
jgi:8-oxo-dGTP diphosphatase